MSIVLDLPWPPRDLSPNARKHWRVKAKVVANFRECCRLTTMTQMPGGLRVLPDGRYRLHLDFLASPKCRSDRDNLVAAMKSGIDGMADALGIDDRQFVELAARLTRLPPDDREGEAVRVTITPDGGQ